MEGNIEGNEDGAGGSGTQKAGKVERKRFAGQKKVKEVPFDKVLHNLDAKIFEI